MLMPVRRSTVLISSGGPPKAMAPVILPVPWPAIGT
jgi:hypothetical protein